VGKKIRSSTSIGICLRSASASASVRVLPSLLAEGLQEHPLELGLGLGGARGEDDRLLPRGRRIDLGVAAGEHGKAARAGHPVGVDVDVEVQVVEAVAGDLVELRAELVDGPADGRPHGPGEGDLEHRAVAVLAGGQGEDVEIPGIQVLVAGVGDLAVAVVVSPWIGEGEDLLAGAEGGRRDQGREEDGGEGVGTAESHNVSRESKTGRPPRAAPAEISRTGPS
jgi:hypothetical protein